MELTFFYISVFIFGLLFGSFSSVLISRWKNKENGILMGRSACPHCKNTLWASELIPLFSFILQGGKCKHCKTRIPWRYPILELSMGLVFVFMSYAGIEIFHVALPSVALFFLIFLGFITIVYIFYDIFFMEIPDEIFIIFIVGNFILFILSYFYTWKFIYFNWNSNHTFHTFYFDKFIGALVLYTFLYAQIFVSGAIYLVKKQKYHDIWELFGYYFLFPFVTIWDFFKEKLWPKNPQKNLENLEDEEEIPFWVGPGDLFLAIIIGWTLGVLHGIVAFFFAYCVGSVIGVIVMMLAGKQKERFEVPFGPFLGIGFFLTILFHSQINNFVNMYFFF